jgi:hypothetical protein
MQLAQPTLAPCWRDPMLGLKGWCLHEDKNRWSNWAPKRHPLYWQLYHAQMEWAKFGQRSTNRVNLFFRISLCFQSTENWPNMVISNFFLPQIWQNLHICFQKTVSTLLTRLFCCNSVKIPNPKKTNSHDHPISVYMYIIFLMLFKWQ